MDAHWVRAIVLSLVVHVFGLGPGVLIEAKWHKNLSRRPFPVELHSPVVAKRATDVGTMRACRST